MNAPEYFHLRPGHSPPELHGAPYRAVVIIEAPVTAEWRSLVSAWLVKSGCLYMMAWGPDCSLWDDSVDYARSEEHTSELQSLMRISYAVFCLKKKKKYYTRTHN